MSQLQAANHEKSGAHHPLRMMYAKTVAGVTNAALVLDRILPAELAVAHFRPGAVHPVTIRFSNASGVPQADGAPDMRGLAMRIALADGASHDMLLANFPTALARDARQFFEFAMTSVGDRETLLARLAARLGMAESRRVAAYLKASLKLCSSLALEHFWSGCAYLWGDAPVRFELRPMASAHPPAGTLPIGNDALRFELADRLANDAVRYRLAVQLYVDETRTPIEDAAVDWKQDISPVVEIGTLVIPRHDMLGAEGERALALVDEFAFDPWNAPEAFRPLGSLNRLRRPAYALSAHARLSD